MPRNIGQELGQITRDIEALNEGNRAVLAFRFNEAAAQSRDGFTMDVYGRLYKADRGYAVAVTKDSFTNLADAIDTLARVQAFGFRNMFLGYWTDPQDGVECIDVSMVTSSFELAQALGRKFKQRAIWDFSTDSAIRLDE